MSTDQKVLHWMVRNLTPSAYDGYDDKVTDAMNVLVQNNALSDEDTYILQKKLQSHGQAGTDSLLWSVVRLPNVSSNTLDWQQTSNAIPLGIKLSIISELPLSPEKLDIIVRKPFDRFSKEYIQNALYNKNCSYETQRWQMTQYEGFETGDIAATNPNVPVKERLAYKLANESASSGRFLRVSSRIQDSGMESFQPTTTPASPLTFKTFIGH